MTSLATLGHPDSKFQTLVPAPAAYAIGVVGAILTVALAGPDDLALAMGCVGIAVLYGSYALFSLAWGSPRERATEWAYTTVGVVTIVLALAVDPRWLALGWAMHGLWDTLHHRDHHVLGLRGIPLWWIQACLVWDIPAAIGLFLVL